MWQICVCVCFFLKFSAEKTCTTLTSSWSCYNYSMWPYMWPYLHVVLWWGECFSSLRWWSLLSPTLCPSSTYTAKNNPDGLLFNPGKCSCVWIIYLGHWSYLFMINCACRFCFIFSTFIIASTVWSINRETWICHSEHKGKFVPHEFMSTLPVLFHSSLLYLTGIFLRFSNSKALSWKNSNCWTEKEQISASRQTNKHGETSYNCQLFPRCLSECFSPSCFSWVTLFLEVPVAFGSAESESLKWTIKNKKREY